MGRMPRIKVENALYYVTSKAGHGQDTFVDEADYREYITLIQKYKTQYGFKLYSFALLPTHLHLLIELASESNISQIMHDINSLYTKLYNSRYNRKGHLFESRFKTVIAEKSSNLLPLTRHIHRNPIRAGLSNDPKEYPFTSHGNYLDPEQRKLPDMKEEIAEVFRQLQGAKDAFDEYITHPIPTEISSFQRSIRKKQILGSDEFKSRVEHIIQSMALEKGKSSRSRKAFRIYMVVTGTMVVVLSVVIGKFYSKHTELRGEYGQTLILYENMLDTLEQERDHALQANQDVEEYQWKIRLTEQALEDLKKEQEKAVELAEKQKMQIDGFTWRIELDQVSGPEIHYTADGAMTINNSHVFSTNTMREGFKSSQYSERTLDNGIVIWETVQRKADGEAANWRGEWDGQILKGTLKRTWPEGVERDFSFQSVGNRMEAVGGKSYGQK